MSSGPLMQNVCLCCSGGVFLPDLGGVLTEQWRVAAKCGGRVGELERKAEESHLPDRGVRCGLYHLTSNDLRIREDFRYGAHRACGNVLGAEPRNTIFHCTSGNAAPNLLDEQLTVRDAAGIRCIALIVCERVQLECLAEAVELRIVAYTHCDIAITHRERLVRHDGGMRIAVAAGGLSVIR